eukprot:12455003-Heterocapsa_arctica.AAC.1
MDWSRHGLGDDLPDTQPASLSFASIDLVDSFYHATTLRPLPTFASNCACVPDSSVSPLSGMTTLVFRWVGAGLSTFCHSALCDAMSVSEARRRGETDQSRAESQFLHDRRPAPLIRDGFPVLAPYFDNADILARSL